MIQKQKWIGAFYPNKALSVLWRTGWALAASLSSLIIESQTKPVVTGVRWAPRHSRPWLSCLTEASRGDLGRMFPLLTSLPKALPWYHYYYYLLYPTQVCDKALLHGTRGGKKNTRVTAQMVIISWIITRSRQAYAGAFCYLLRRTSKDSMLPAQAEGKFC